LSAGWFAGRFATRFRSFALGAGSCAVRGIPCRLIAARALRHPSLRLGGTGRPPPGFAAWMLPRLSLEFGPVSRAGAGMGGGPSLVFGPVSDRGVRAGRVRGVVSTHRRVG